MRVFDHHHYSIIGEKVQGENSIEYQVYSIELRKRKKRYKKESEKIDIADSVYGYSDE